MKRTAPALQVVEVDPPARIVRHGGDVDDPCRGAFALPLPAGTQEPRQQQMSEQEVALKSQD